MKRFGVVFCCLAVVGSTAALASPEGYFVSGFLEQNFTDDSKSTSTDYDFIEGGSGGGLELGYFFSPNWGARLEWSGLAFGRAGALGDVDEFRLGADLLYRFHDTSNVYALAGMKGLSAGVGHTALDVGFGVGLPFGEHWAAYAESAAYFGAGSSFTDFGVKVGLRYQFFDSEMSFIHPHVPVRTELLHRAEPDSDQDGVVDRLDQCLETPMQYAVNSQGCTIAEQQLTAMDLFIQFPNNSAMIDTLYYPEIGKVADLMRSNPDTIVEIGGHTSAPASAAYNQTLSEQRAQSVAEVLTKIFNVSADRVTYVGYGESRPRDTSNTPAAHKLNRRIEAVIYNIELKPVLRN